MMHLTDEEFRAVCQLIASPSTGALATRGLKKLLAGYQNDLEMNGYRQLGHGMPTEPE